MEILKKLTQVDRGLCEIAFENISKNVTLHQFSK